MTTPDWQWKETCWAVEEPRAPLYCVAFNFFHRSTQHIFATAGSHKAVVYKCLEDGGLEIVQMFIDRDPKEEYFICKWSINLETSDPLLLLAGKNGLLKVINCTTGVLETTFEGHGEAINDVAVNPTRPWLVATASKDQAVRLWNLKTRVCVLVFQGEGGHRNEVLSLDWSPNSGQGRDELVSAGMDSAVKIWSLAEFEDVITASDNYVATVQEITSNRSNGNSKEEPMNKAFPTRQVTFPSFSTKTVHSNYVDCVRFLGDYILSKSVDNKIICWKRTPEKPRKPGVVPRLRNEGTMTLVQELQLEDTKGTWWLRFSLDRSCNVLAVGTRTGRVLVYNPHKYSSQYITKLRPRRAAGKHEEKMLVRQTAVSYNGEIIVSCHEDGSITRYDRFHGAMTAQTESLPATTTLTAGPDGKKRDVDMRDEGLSPLKPTHKAS